MPAARRLFFGTILYLPLLWIVLLADHFTHVVVIDYTILPAVNASLNAIVHGVAHRWAGSSSAEREIARHRACMLAAFATSALFLTSYLVYHAKVGSVPVPGAGRCARRLLRILITHVILAAAILPLALVTLSRALARRFDRHRADRALDAADLAVRVGDGRRDLPDAVSLYVTRVRGIRS